jgi:DNA-binding NarL/FixJ family response regulator
MKPEIKVCIVDDHEIFRDGLKFILSQVIGYNVVGESGNGRDFLELLNHITPDIVLMDISMPEMDGIDASELAIKKFPNLKIIALSSYGDDLYYYKMVKAGVSGFVQKKSGKDELEKAINAVFSGENYFPPQLLQKIIIKLGQSGPDSISSPDLNLSKREKEILKFICQGYSNNEISEMLYISPKTVDNHRTNLLSKTSSRNSASLVMFAIKNHLIEL